MVTPALLQPSASTSALGAHSAFGPEAVQVEEQGAHG